MFHIKTVRLKRFCQYDDFSVDIAPGLTRVSGPNGSGKTNFFRGLIYAITGWCDPSWGSQSELQKEGEPVPGFAEVDFELNDELYTLRRYTVTSTKAVDQLHTGDRLVTEKRQRVNAWLEEALGVNLTVMAQLMWLRQEESAWLLTAPAAVINTFLGTVFDTKKLDKLREHLRTAASDVLNLRSDFDEREASAKTVLEQAPHLEELKKELSDKLREVAELEAASKNVQHAWTRANWELTVSKIKKELEASRKRKDELEVAVRNEVSPVGDAEAAEAALEERKRLCVEEYQLKFEECVEQVKLLEKLDELLSSLNHLSKCTGPEKRCDYCRQLLEDVEAYKNRVASKLCGTTGTLGELLEQKVAERENIASQIGDLEAVKIALAEREMAIDNNLAELKKQKAAWQAYQADLKALEDVQACIKRAEDLLELMNKTPISDIDAVALADQLEVTRKVLSVVKSEHDSLESEIRFAKLEIQKCAEDRQAYNLNSYVKGLLVSLRDCLSQSRAQAKYITGKIDALNSHIAFNLSLSGMPFSLYLDKESHIFKYTMSDGTETHSAGKLSGAQKAAASIAVQMALANTAVPGLTLLLVDEADAALSPENKHIAADLYRTLAANVQSVSGSVLVISQSDQVSDDCEYTIEVSN